MINQITEQQLEQKKTKCKTPYGLLLSLNQRFAREEKFEPMKVYTVKELRTVFGEIVVEMNRIRYGKDRMLVKQEDYRKHEGEQCPHCGQRLKNSFKVTLNKNIIEILYNLYKFGADLPFLKTKDIFDKQIVSTSSGSAILTQLKYLGAIYQYYDDQDMEEGKVRSGKWRLTDSGIKFLKNRKSLPSFVSVKDSDVVETGELIFISDDRLKWMSEEEIWKELKEFWKEEKDYE